MNKKVIHQVLEAVVSSHAALIAVESPEGELRYDQLWDRSSVIKDGLIAVGVRPGDPVAVYGHSSLSYIINIVGVLRSGAMFMPVEENYPVHRAHYLLSYVTPVAVICHRDDVSRLTTLTGHIKDFNPVIVEVHDENELCCWRRHEQEWKEESLERTPLEVDHVFTGEESCYLLYTSGSTGFPKVIEGVHKSLSHFIHWEMNEFSMQPGTRVSQLAPITFDVSLRDIFAPLLSGGRICIPPADVRADGGKLLDWLISREVELSHMVPSVFRQLQEQVSARGLKRVGKLRHLLLAGEALYGRDVLSWRACVGSSVELVNLYGPTETTLAKVFNRINALLDDPNSIVPLGSPIPNTSIAILSGSGLCKTGAIGEICIKTPFRTKGYYRDGKQTLERFVQNPLHNDFEDIIYKTGDLGRYLSDGSIAYVGRQDTQVKIRGNRVELSEIERQVLSCEGIRQTVVMVLKDAFDDDTLCCYYCVSGSGPEPELRPYLHAWLPEYMIPSYYVKLESFPLNLNGKIDRKSLPRPEEILYSRLVYEAPVTATEVKLAAIWSGILGLNRCGVNNSFFELGGHSLSATRVISGIYKELSKEVSLKEFFERSTIRSLAAFLDGRSQQQFEPIPPAPVGEHYPLSQAQKQIWIVAQTPEGNAAYNMPGCYLFYKRPDASRLSKALAQLIERHESLRTSFIMAGGEARQVIHERVEFDLFQYDATDEDWQRVRDRFIKNELDNVFDLSKAPLLRAALIRLENERYLFIFSIHHIVCDGWSRGILLHDLLRLYSREPLTPLRIQYKDYVHWQATRLDQVQAIQKDSEYWRHKLSGTPVMPLPTDYQRTPSRNYKGRKEPLLIDAEQVRSIKGFCKEENVSLFAFFMSVINVLLYSYSGHRDLAIGSPVSGRDHPDLDNQIGIFLNNLVFRMHMAGEEPFRQFMRRTYQEILLSFQHQRYPFSRVVEDSGYQKNEGRNPFYDVLVVMDNEGLNGSREDENKLMNLLDVEEVPLHDQTTKLDLTFFITEGTDIYINIEYSTDLFTEHTIRRLKLHAQKIIYAAIHTPDQRINNLILSISDERSLHVLQKIAESNIGKLGEDF